MLKKYSGSVTAKNSSLIIFSNEIEIRSCGNEDRDQHAAMLKVIDEFEAAQYNNKTNRFLQSGLRYEVLVLPLSKEVN